LKDLLDLILCAEPMMMPKNRTLSFLILVFIIFLALIFRNSGNHSQRDASLETPNQLKTQQFMRCAHKRMLFFGIINETECEILKSLHDLEMINDTIPVRHILDQTREKIRNLVKTHFQIESELCLIQTNMIVRRQQYRDFVHADNCRYNKGTNTCRRYSQPSPLHWYEFTSILYLNQPDGGNLFFPHHNDPECLEIGLTEVSHLEIRENFGTSSGASEGNKDEAGGTKDVNDDENPNRTYIWPQCGTFVAFRSEVLHGVTRVFSEQRYALALFWTTQCEHKNEGFSPDAY